MKKAIVLLSGGLDSTTALYLAKSEGFGEIYALTFEYGQKHDRELRAAREVARAAGVKEHKFVKLLLNQWDGCSLTDPKMEVPDGDLRRDTVPDTYVPARNMVFLSVAASYADALGVEDIYIGDQVYGALNSIRIYSKDGQFKKTIETGMSTSNIRFVAE